MEVTNGLQKEMAIHSSTLAWGIPWTEEPGGLQYMGSQRIGHDLVTNQQQRIFKEHRSNSKISISETVVDKERLHRE